MDEVGDIDSKIVINEAGNVIRLELKPPFAYLHSLKAGNNGNTNGHQSEMKGRKKKTFKGIRTDGSSLQVSIGDPAGT